MPYRRCFISDDVFPDTIFFDVRSPVPTDNPDLRGFLDTQTEHWAVIMIHPDIPDPQAFMDERKDWLKEQTKEHPGATGVIAPDGSLHWGKIVPVRVSDEAVIEWMADSREANRSHGVHPDRPPDVDTPTNREWIMHPGEAGLEVMKADADDPVSIFPVMVVVHKVEIPGIPVELVLKLMVSCIEESDGSYYGLRLKVQRSSGEIDLDRTLRIPLDQPGDWIGDQMAAIDATFEPIYAVDDHPLVTTYSDFEAMMEESLVARREMAAFYGVPENWRKLAEIGNKDQAEARV